MRVRRAALLIASLLVTTTASGQWREWDAEFDDDKKTWKEIQAQLPSYPKLENLVRVQTGSATSHQFYVDTASLSIGDDDVIRYSVLVRTAGGATNVTFEGMRCETREQKLYAIGRSDNSWVRARDTTWRRVVLRDLTPHHHTLFVDYFCALGRSPTPVARAVNALKRGYGLKPSTATDG